MRTVFLCVLIALLISDGTMADQKWVRALRKHIGKENRVCGVVAGYGIGTVKPTRDCSFAKLNFQDATSQQFYVKIPTNSDTSPVGAANEYATHDICVTGTLELDDKDAMNIVVTRPEQIEVTDHRPLAPFGKGAHFMCEVGIRDPEPVHEVRPDYTRKLMQERAEDDVIMDVVIDADGSVADARVLQGRYPEMNDQALAAVRQWRFRPAQLNGVPVACVAMVDLTFRLR